MNIDALDDSMDTNNYLTEFCDTFSLKTLILGKTCFKAVSGTSVDVMLANKPRRFEKTAIIETGLSDHHKLIFSFFCTHFARLPLKNWIQKPEEIWFEKLSLWTCKGSNGNV